MEKDCPGKTGQDECSVRDNSKEDLAQPSKAINDYMPQHEGGNDEAVLQRMLEGLVAGRSGRDGGGQDARLVGEELAPVGEHHLQGESGRSDSCHSQASFVLLTTFGTAADLTEWRLT